MWKHHTHLRGVSTKLNKYIVFTMQTYKKLIYTSLLLSCIKPVARTNQIDGTWYLQTCWKLFKQLASSLWVKISGYIHITCSSLKTTSLLQVVNRLDASWLSRLFIQKLDASCFNKVRFLPEPIALSTKCMSYWCKENVLCQYKDRFWGQDP